MFIKGRFNSDTLWNAVIIYEVCSEIIETTQIVSFVSDIFCENVQKHWKVILQNNQ